MDDKVVQHPLKTGGRNIGNVVQQLCEDIGFLDCTAPFANEIPDLAIQTKSFLHSTQIKDYDYVVIDSCFTRVHKLRVLGVRTGADRRLPRADTGERSTQRPLPDHHYLKFVHSIYSDRIPQFHRNCCY